MGEMFFQQGCEEGGLVTKANLGVPCSHHKAGSLQEEGALQVALLADWRFTGNKA